MRWDKEYTWITEYEYASINQHGARYRKKESRRTTKAKISCDMSETLDMKTLILLSHTLDTPVRYDFSVNPQRAYIKVVSAEKL